MCRRAVSARALSQRSVTSHNRMDLEHTLIKYSNLSFSLSLSLSHTHTHSTYRELAFWIRTNSGSKSGDFNLGVIARPASHRQRREVQRCVACHALSPLRQNICLIVAHCQHTVMTIIIILYSLYSGSLAPLQKQQEDMLLLPVPIINTLSTH
jgi:hypothetical protein